MQHCVGNILRGRRRGAVDAAAVVVVIVVVVVVVADGGGADTAAAAVSGHGRRGLLREHHGLCPYLWFSDATLTNLMHSDYYLKMLELTHYVICPLY